MAPPPPARDRPAATRDGALRCRRVAPPLVRAAKRCIGFCGYRLAFKALARAHRVPEVRSTRERVLSRFS
jgi:hypothetical protein